MLMGDTLLFILGRYMGWGLLGLLCRLSINPESCILRSAESFYKRGKDYALGRQVYSRALIPWRLRWQAA